jgi:hypothetical protein
MLGTGKEKEGSRRRRAECAESVLDMVRQREEGRRWVSGS